MSNETFNFPTEAYGYVPGAIPVKLIYSESIPENPVEGIFWMQIIGGVIQGTIRLFSNGMWLEFALSTSLISETPPESTASGVRWYKPSEGTTYVYYCDEDGCQWVQEPVQTALQPPLSGTTALRPSDVPFGTPYFDTTLNLPIWYSPTGWVDASNTPV